jgi:hypothetical protein
MVSPGSQRRKVCHAKKHEERHHKECFLLPQSRQELLAANEEEAALGA